MAHQFNDTPWGTQEQDRPDAVRVVIVDPESKICIVCGEEFFRRYPGGRLKTPKRWSRALYCGRECCGAFRGRMSKGVPKTVREIDSLPPYLQALEPQGPIRASLSPFLQALEPPRPQR
jgi:hypothetical protein